MQAYRLTYRLSGTWGSSKGLQSLGQITFPWERIFFSLFKLSQAGKTFPRFFSRVSEKEIDCKKYRQNAITLPFKTSAIIPTYMFLLF